MVITIYYQNATKKYNLFPDPERMQITAFNPTPFVQDLRIRTSLAFITLSQSVIIVVFRIPGIRMVYILAFE